MQGFVKNQSLNIKDILDYEMNRKLRKTLYIVETKALKPTESELEILQVLWAAGKATVREVHEQMVPAKDTGYTTTLKLMQIMLEKGLVVRDASHRTHVYKPAVNKEHTQKFLVRKMIRGLFGGSPGQLVLQALGEQKVSEDELEKIQLLINNLKTND